MEQFTGAAYRYSLCVEFTVTAYRSYLTPKPFPSYFHSLKHILFLRRSLMYLNIIK